MLTVRSSRVFAVEIERWVSENRIVHLEGALRVSKEDLSRERVNERRSMSSLSTLDWI